MYVHFKNCKIQESIKKKKITPQAYRSNIVTIYFNWNKWNINQKKLRQNDQINCWSVFKSRKDFPISLKKGQCCYLFQSQSQQYDIWVRLIKVKATKTPKINISWTQRGSYNTCPQIQWRRQSVWSPINKTGMTV